MTSRTWCRFIARFLVVFRKSSIRRWTHIHADKDREEQNASLLWTKLGGLSPKTFVRKYTPIGANKKCFQTINS